ncbi:polyphosphate kinase 2 family protein [bacterium]|nr:polyphosphate kinase 2 family protein [bacterium]
MHLKNYRVDGDGSWKLDRHDPADTDACADKIEARKRLESLRPELVELQRRLYAGNTHGLLIVLQGLDAAGKDGTIRHVLSGVNPQGVHVSSFKVPSAVEAAHDYLWRIHHSTPARGRFNVFNRSHYEDVVAVRVHADKILPEWARQRPNLWDERYEQINNFEKLLVENNIHIIKIYLNISRDEQKRRLQRRLDDPARNWKFSASDLPERALWDQYQVAYEQAFKHTSTDYAPWHIVPSDKKWFRDLVIAELVVKTLRDLNLEYPKADPKMLEKVRVS